MNKKIGTIVDLQADSADSITDKHLHSATVEDATIQASMQPWANMECYQLSSGKTLAKMDIIDLGRQQVVRESQLATVQKVGVTPANFCTISYCTLDPNFRFTELSTDISDTLFFLPEQTEYDIFVPTGVQTNYVSLSQETFLNNARILNPSLWENPPQQLVSLKTDQFIHFKAALNLWFNTAEALRSKGIIADDNIVSDSLLQQVLHIVTATNLEDSPPSPTERQRAFHTCRMARAFVEHKLAADIIPTIADICAFVGVSERTLQYAFRAYVNMPPLAYLRLCRLNQVRATLLVSDPQTTTVTALAMRFGFLHLGRFALDYKQVFSESPSATLTKQYR
ncbi:MAG: helix-turn-helix domain-containing protein [Gammaproteobacteria bacterium]|uniref:Helix-turn-helix domain-containing protein n=1 Tax=Marinomonas polaris DSM 16579 TaxID=1122206 RepID=A0A1M5IC64_9GAMM|nr:helix-turn-helix domain-containing protein [Marinomonas polaris]MBU1297377.1 helix-turn-helix domain-containing protein [Gammaproteobacteria bacterium]MBU1466698.1 helix-turn-helix domain-containing protein [Gammaproteobacteria bacterium]MBU2021599.1 helix-turn-helix domain-containing protein [Gammaproteobacteria bacterium]MBU2236830.1 helix-turn-helix domain-containing protein [Gammaproteobacteria bacterium]MBU2320411.1 helix-turn-helix domain-containing protein [Gammaproteobacteria bacter